MSSPSPSLAHAQPSRAGSAGFPSWSATVSPVCLSSQATPPSSPGRSIASGRSTGWPSVSGPRHRARRGAAAAGDRRSTGRQPSTLVARPMRFRPEVLETIAPASSRGRAPARWSDRGQKRRKALAGGGRGVPGRSSLAGRTPSRARGRRLRSGRRFRRGVGTTRVGARRTQRGDPRRRRRARAGHLVRDPARRRAPCGRGRGCARGLVGDDARGVQWHRPPVERRSPVAERGLA